MKTLQLVQSKRGRQAIRLGITVGLAMLFLTALLWISASSTPAIASLPAAKEITALNNGSVITVGVAADLNGPVPFLGWKQANAVQLAINQTNAAGGIDIGGVTYTLTLVKADSACNPAQAIVAANTLLNAGAVAVVGHTCSSASFAAQPIYNAAGVTMVSPSSSLINLTEQGYTTTFRVNSKDNAGAALMAVGFSEWFEMDKVAIVEMQGWEWVSDKFSKTFTNLGGTITSRHTVTSTDYYTAALTAIQPENPDAVFYAEWDANNAGFLSSIASNLSLNVIGWHAGDDVSTLDTYATAAGAAAEGDYAAMSGRLTRYMPGYNVMNAAYQAAGFLNYGDEAQAWGAYAYDAAKIIIAAIDRADSTNPALIRDEIAATADYNGVVGTYQSFDNKGDVVPQLAWLELYQNGEWVMVYPYKEFMPLILKESQ